MCKKENFVIAMIAIVLLVGYGTKAGLVSQWNFDNGTANDSVGINNGILMDNATIVNDAERGLVASFDGSGDYIDCGNDNSLQITDSLTVALWFNSTNWTDLHSSYNGIISKRNDFFTALDWEIYYDCYTKGIIEDSCLDKQKVRDVLSTTARIYPEQFSINMRDYIEKELGL